jgi:predicted DNA-binding transcriptional regulator AlpA
MKIIGFEELRVKLGGKAAPHRRTIERMVERGEFVRPVRTSPGRLGFIEHEVDAWIESRKDEVKP